jgi:hypothetical protein
VVTRRLSDPDERVADIGTNQVSSSPRVRVHFALAFLIAPFAGSLGAGVLATVLAAPYCFSVGPWRYQLAASSLSSRLSSTIAIGMFTALGAFCVAAAYTIIGGAIAVRRYARNGTAPSLPGVLISSSLAGVLPIVGFPLLLGVPPEFTRPGGPGAGWALVFFLSIAVTTSLITSWTFWRLGLRRRT